MSGNIKQGRKPIHDPAFKVAVARDYLTSALGYGAIATKYGLPGIPTVRFFVKWYRKKYPTGFIDTTNQKDAVKNDQELKQANLKIVALEMLIENASKELGIDLLKKFGTKQPKK